MVSYKIYLLDSLDNDFDTSTQLCRWYSDRSIPTIFYCIKFNFRCLKFSCQQNLSKVINPWRSQNKRRIWLGFLQNGSFRLDIGKFSKNIYFSGFLIFRYRKLLTTIQHWMFKNPTAWNYDVRYPTLYIKENEINHFPLKLFIAKIMSAHLKLIFELKCDEQTRFLVEFRQARKNEIRVLLRF